MKRVFFSLVHIPDTESQVIAGDPRAGGGDSRSSDLLPQGLQVWRGEGSDDGNSLLSCLQGFSHVNLSYSKGKDISNMQFFFCIYFSQKADFLFALNLPLKYCCLLFCQINPERHTPASLISWCFSGPAIVCLPHLISVSDGSSAQHTAFLGKVMSFTMSLLSFPAEHSALPLSPQICYPGIHHS